MSNDNLPPQGDSIRDFAEFREYLERLSEPGLAKKQAKVIRKEIYDIIDMRVHNAEIAAVAGQRDAVAASGAGVNWIDSKIQAPQPGMIAKRWNCGTVWAGLFNGDAKMASCDWWVSLAAAPTPDRAAKAEVPAGEQP